MTTETATGLHHILNETRTQVHDPATGPTLMPTCCSVRAHPERTARPGDETVRELAEQGKLKEIHREPARHEAEKNRSQREMEDFLQGKPRKC